uniref:Molybdenum cofactor sulfurase n=2 Tax=Anthurium amnicola TaxID=1678845 RepID=A0A1D1XM72_9ARAE
MAPVAENAAAATPPPTGAPRAAPSASDGGADWKERILIPALLGVVAGAGGALLSKHREVHGVANLCATYAANMAIVTGCYCGAREFVRKTRASEPDDLINSVIGGFACGALLGRVQGGQLGALRYSVMFAVAGTAFDYAALQLKPLVKNMNSSWRLPEWSPIQVLDEEALAAKHAREEQLYAQRTLRDLNKEES